MIWKQCILLYSFVRLNVYYNISLVKINKHTNLVYAGSLVMSSGVFGGYTQVRVFAYTFQKNKNINVIRQLICRRHITI